MTEVKLIQDDNKKSWISTTGYRTLIILKSLIEKDRSIDELIEVLKNNSITAKSVSKDTVRLTINTLKTAGCIFEKPKKANGYKYHLIYHPFVLKLTHKELKVLIKLREKLAENLPWNTVLDINALYKKVLMVTADKNQMQDVENTRPLKDVNETILYKISDPKLEGKKVQIKYFSPKNGIEDIDIIPQKISYENGKIYLWCYIFKYNTNSMLNIERIKKINNINISESFNTPNSYEVIYKLTGNAFKTFEPKEYEQIIKKNEESLTVKANVANEFWFIQRMLLFGCDFNIISPDFFKEKLINKLKLIKRGYEQ